MNAGQQTTRRIILRSAAAEPHNDDTTPSQHVPPVAPAAPSTAYAVHAGVVLSRPPQITRDLHPFESAFFLYQKRLNERLALPFTRYFYFKKRTPADLEWKRKMRQRLTPARDIGRYNAYADDAWNDEVLMGAKESELEWQVERLLEDAATDGREEGEAEEKGMKKVEREVFDKPMPRRTEADEKMDTKSLNRALQRTLYLLVKNKEGSWQFPQDRLHEENLHGAAARILIASGGQNMNTWVVGHVPIGYHQIEYARATKLPSGLSEYGAKTFFLKARIMAGQINLKENTLGFQDFKWLAKEEVQKEVEGPYWKSVKNMLAER
ncbi:hypothetical protein ACEQ8H_007547 [Pleosporales sp. CAS-2024a]